MLRIMPRFSWIWLLYFLLSGCATVNNEPPAKQTSWKERQQVVGSIQNWHVNGKIAVQTANDSGSASVNWSQRNQQYTISLLGPLGSGSVTLIGQPGQVQMDASDGKHLTANSAEQLLAQQWGWQLPISNMSYWVRGLPAPGAAFSSQFDQYHRLTELNQSGWNIRFLSYTNTGAIDLPEKIAISGPALKSKIVIYAWKFE